MESILLVSEEDGSETYYRVSIFHTDLLAHINGNTFVFTTSNGISCSNPQIKVDRSITDFVSKFRYGKYTTNWRDIANRIQIVEAMDCRCLNHDYSISFTH